ncbi:MAG TPA: aldose epimerase family protein [Caulobacterales bacterium]|nr:aldose epimerase family protein [Caulobacterales bacterium]
MSAGVVTVFGETPDGAPVEAVEVAAGALRVRVLALGACVQSLSAPDRTGAVDDIVFGHDDVRPYVETPLYVGATMGRFANRIADGRFTLDGRAYELVKSDGANTLHGGMRGFDKVMWRIESAAADRVTLLYLSPDGDQGFPGAVEARVTYALDAENRMVTTFDARTDAPTVVSMTNHCYFNLDGVQSGETMLRHRLTIDAEAYTPVNDAIIPTGEIRAVAGTPFDFRAPREIGERIEADDPQLKLGHGYDHNFVLRGGASIAPKFAARVEAPRSGRVLELFTTEPGLQLYSGNFLDGSLVGKGGARYVRRGAFCLEPQEFPDAPNQPAFPSARLDPGELYRHVSVYKFSVR